MHVWALADLHLSFGVPDKSMDVFGDAWVDHPQKIKAQWEEQIEEKDLVLLPGDISWGKTFEEALPDLEWIDHLPGTKVMIKGNHDYWWSSVNKVRKRLPPSIHVIQNDAFVWNDIAVGGAKMYDSDEYSFDSIIHFVKNECVREKAEETPFHREKLMQRELKRLEMSLEKLSPTAKTRIAMTHYPPIGLDLSPCRASRLFLEYGVEHVLFGHLHNVTPRQSLFGEKDGITYQMVSADFVDFSPILVL